jgi:hypothetical protein
MLAPSASSRRPGALLAGFGFLCVGVLCFFAGRYTTPHTSANVPIAEPQPLVSTNQPVQSAVSAAPVIAEKSTPFNRPSGWAWDEKEWQQVVSRPGSPARAEALVALLEKLALTDPDRAFALAQAERNLKLHDHLVQAALRGWARLSPTNALNRALALPDLDERERSVATVFAGAVAANPESAVALGKFLFQQNPDQTAGYGASLIEALCHAGNFQTAVQMAGSGDAQTRSGWMALAYSSWAEFQPEEAARAAVAIEDRAARNEALHGIVGGWAEADPPALIQFVAQLPSGDERNSLLSQALERWVKHDPEAASGWINDREAGTDLDEGVAAVAAMDSVRAEVAVGWAESVNNPKLRSETLVTVIRNWLTMDLPAARQYFESTKNLLPEDRQELSEIFRVFSHESQ